MTGTAVEESRTFEEKLGDKLRESIGDLISDEDLAAIVKRGLDEAFF